MWHGANCLGIDPSATLMAAEIARAYGEPLTDDVYNVMGKLMLAHRERRGFVDPGWVLKHLIARFPQDSAQ